MTYTRQTWADDDPARPVSAARLNYIETGVEGVSRDVDSLGISTRTYGTLANGAADDSQAVKNAIAAALKKYPDTRNQNLRVYLPAGTYNILANGLFSDFDFASLGLSASTRDGIVFVGDGRRSTIINLVTNGTEKWLYDNASVSTQRMERLYFEHIGFRTDNPEFGNGFRQFSQGGEKQFKFFDCEFTLGTVMQCEGTGNADLNKFLMCYITAHRSVLTLNNSQSVANEFLGCDVTVYRSLEIIKAGGGGSTNFIAGNYEMYPHATDTTDHYLIDCPASPATSASNATTTLSNIRFEIHGPNKKLVRTVGTTTPVNVNFDTCSFGVVSDGDREAVTITGTKRVVFTNCLLNSAFTYRADATFAGSPSGAQLIFDKCDIGLTTTLASRCTATGNAARIIANGCYRFTSGTSSPPIIMEDFDFGWRGLNPRGPAAVSKIATIKPSATALPVASTVTSALPRVQIPAGAWVKRIVVKKPSHSGTGSADEYQLHVGAADKSVILGSSTLGTWGGSHSIELNDLGVLAFDTIAIWATGGTAAAYSGGTNSIAYVEYI